MLKKNKTYNPSVFIGFAIFFIIVNPTIKAFAQAVPLYTYKIVNTFPHNSEAFTQGMFFKNGELFESTGKYKESTIRKVDLLTGRTLLKKNLPPTVFGEGVTDWGNRIIGITWKSHKGYIWDINSLEVIKEFSYKGEGWGLTHNDTHIIMSDGTPILKFLDPITLLKSRQILVTLNSDPLYNLNELEWINGEIYANIWQTDYIARINPLNGKVIGLIDLSGLLTAEDLAEGKPGVLNGIALNNEGRLFVTGKLWPKLFEIEVFLK
ncbi:MAG: glutaminyl-peptide cyclotransferase [Sphingomonadales bacterium]|jgi:glutamine cyclotransferase